MTILILIFIIKFSFPRFREDEVRAEMGEREVQKLQKEVDKLEVNFVFSQDTFKNHFLGSSSF